MTLVLLFSWVFTVSFFQLKNGWDTGRTNGKKKSHEAQCRLTWFSHLLLLRYLLPLSYSRLKLRVTWSLIDFFFIKKKCMHHSLSLRLIARFYQLSAEDP